uniref:Pyrin domain-containing protein n=1 Tax=Pogona vitticeps TaxID=103695 RepID=A0ABM5EIL7_9SAUR
MSGAIEDCLLEALEDLDRSDLERFLWKLGKLPVRRRYKKIPRSRLENATLFRVVDLLLRFYTEEYAPRVTVRVLKGINCMQQAESLKETLEIDTTSSESSDNEESDESSDSEDDSPEEDDAIKKSDSPKVTAGQNSAFRTQGLQKLQPGAGSQGATARGNGKETQGKKEDVSEKADSSDSESDDDDSPEEDDAIAIKKSDPPKLTAGQNSAFRTQGIKKLQPGAGSQGATARGKGKETQGKKEDVSKKADPSSSESDDDDDNSGSESDDDNDSPEEDDAIKKSDPPKVTARQNSAFRTQGLQKLQPGAGSQGATARGKGKETQGKKEDVSEKAEASGSESDDDDDTSSSESSEDEKD